MDGSEAYSFSTICGIILLILLIGPVKVLIVFSALWFGSMLVKRLCKGINRLVGEEYNPYAGERSILSMWFELTSKGIKLIVSRIGGSIHNARIDILDGIYKFKMRVRSKHEGYNEADTIPNRSLVGEPEVITVDKEYDKAVDLNNVYAEYDKRLFRSGRR